MATVDIGHQEHSKRDRILNALAVYPEDHEISNQAIAELTQASPSYVYQLRTAVEEGDLSDEEIEAAADDQLRSEYRGRIDGVIEDADPTSATDEPEAADDSNVAPSTAEPKSNGTVPVEEIDRVRERLIQYREDADFERERFEGAGKNVAEEKYFIANRAVELLDELVES